MRLASAAAAALAAALAMLLRAHLALPTFQLNDLICTRMRMCQCNANALTVNLVEWDFVAVVLHFHASRIGSDGDNGSSRNVERL